MKGADLTWVEAVAGDTGALQPVGQLSGEEHIKQLAVAVSSDVVPGRLTGDQVPLGSQQREVSTATAVQKCSHSDHATGTALLQLLQEKVGEQEVTQVVDSKRHGETIRSAPWPHHT